MKFKKSFVAFFFVLNILIVFASGAFAALNNTYIDSQTSGKAFKSASILCGTNIKEKERPKPAERVYVGGTPIGLELLSRGVIVVGFTDVETDDGVFNPAKKALIQTGDILTHLDNIAVNSHQSIAVILKDYKGFGTVPFTVLRNGTSVTGLITPKKDALTGAYKIGVWVKDSSSGIGTLTYVKEDLQFGSLGHPVTDSDTRIIMPISDGQAYDCNIIGIVKGRRGAPGELKGIFLRSNHLGTIDANNSFGVYGRFFNERINSLFPEPLEVAARDEIRMGKAKIVTTLCGNTPEVFDVEIIKVVKQRKKGEKGMVISVKDKRLLSETGGIVQGMSGSPIIQNGKIVGAVTHVFINDPTKGYGVFLDWMLTN
jgi:stage IV sporulation protein B